MPYGRPVRIVHVSDCFAPRTGGMETQVRMLAREQVRRGHDVTVITAAWDREGEVSEPGVSIERITFPTPGDLPIHPRARARIAQRLRAGAPDVVHVHLGEISPFGWGALRAVAQLRVPAISTVHSVWSPLMRRGVAPMGRRWTRKPMLMTAVSRMAAERVADALGVAVDILPNGIDTTAWAPRPRIVHAGVRFVAVQRLAPRKRTAALIRAFATASRGVPDMRLDIVGDGPDRTRMERRVRGWGRTDSITFHGRLDAEGIRELFRVSDVFAQASRRESFGIAALEARASGLPVLAFQESGTADFIVGGQNGILASDDAEFARAMVTLSGPTGALAALTAGARSTPVAQSWDAVIPRVDELYDRARHAIRLRG